MGACRGRPRFSFGAASLFGNVVVEVGRFLVLLRPWIVALSTCRKVLLLTRLSRDAHAGNGFHAQTGEVVRVEVVHPRCAGIDISKKDAKVCVRVQGSGRRATTASVTTWGAMSNEILALREHLVAEKVTYVVMESTGDYVRHEGA